MMKAIVFSALLCGLALAQQYEKDAYVQNIRSSVNEDGSYEYQYETSNGIVGQENGVGGSYANGYFAYYTPDGQQVALKYTADENGFHPSGDHLPTPPPVPAHVLRALEYIRTHPPKEE